MINSRILILLLCIPQLLGAQARLGVYTDVSKILIHTSKINFDANYPSYAFGLSYMASPNPQNESYVKRGLPWVGISFQYLDYGDPNVGKVWCLMPSVNFRHAVRARSHMETMIAVGGGFATRYYDRQPWSDTNYNALGSHFNNSTRFAESYFYHLRSGDQISASLVFQHVSSSASSAPNYGINNLGLGLAYHFGFPDRVPYGKPMKAEAAASRNSIALGYSFTTDQAILGFEFPIYTLSFKHHWVDTSRLASWYVGGEAIYNSKIRNKLKYRSLDGTSFPVSEYMAYYLSAGREWYIGDFGFCLGAQIGYDVQSRKITHLEKPSIYYYPFNVNYAKQNLLRNTFFGLGLCTKFVTAQYLDMTIGTFF